MRGHGAELVGRDLMTLKFGKRATQFLRETGQPRAGPEEPEIRSFARQQRPQHHDTALGIQQPRLGFAEFVQHPKGEPLEGEHLETRVARQRFVRQQLAFELIGHLLRCEQNQRWAVGCRQERGADFRQAAMSLAAAGGAEEITYAHAALFANEQAQANKIFASRLLMPPLP